MGYLIETSVWVDVERGRLSPERVAAVTGEEPVFLSPVTIAELRYGVDAAKKPEVREKRAAALDRLRKKPVLVIDAETGDVFGILATKLKTTGRGHDFRVQDLWIASQAVQHGLRLLTLNEKDFRDIPGLTVVALPGA